MAADYKDTVHLPRTDFPMKANLPQREPEILRAWEEEGVFEKMVAQNAARPGPAPRKASGSSTTGRPTPTATSTWAT